MNRPDPAPFHFHIRSLGVRATGVILAIGWFFATMTAVPAEPVPLGRVPVPPRQGFQLSVEMESVPGNGYQPVHLVFRPVGRTFTQQRNLTIELTPGDQLQTNLDYRYRCGVQLPQRATGHRSVQYLPYYVGWSSLRVRVLENDQPIPNAMTVLNIGNSRLQPLEHCSIGVVVATNLGKNASPPPWRVCPDVRSLQTVFDGALPADPDTTRLDHRQALREIDKVQEAAVQFRQLDIAQLPENWLAYSQLDVILIAAPDLERLQQQPAAYRALTDWVANGGRLWVYASEIAAPALLDQVRLEPPRNVRILTGRRLEDRIRLNRLSGHVSWHYDSYSGPMLLNADNQQIARGAGTLPTGNLSPIAQLQTETVEDLRKHEHPLVYERTAEELRQRIRQGDWGMGRVTVIRDEDPFPGSYQLWQAVVDVDDADEFNWVHRHGVNVPGGDWNYWSLLIAAVGQPPVKLFVVLNTLFVLAIGPFFYLYLRRRQRLFLLFFIAPVTALLITGGLVLYAYLSDGVETRIRTRQITWVDTHNGYLATQSRQTYFAVLDSYKGLQMPPEAAVYPVARGSIRGGRGYRHNAASNVEGTITAGEDSVRLRGCFLPPRAQTQMLVCYPQAVEETITLDWNTPQPQVHNHLPYDLDRLLVRDKAGRYWHASGVGSGQSRSLEDAGGGADGAGEPPAVIRFEKLDPDVRPRLRSGTDPWGRYGIGDEVGQWERRLQQWMNRMPRGTFIAESSDDERSLLGVERAQSVQREHYLMGRLP
ncbi:hypothetical protein [Roseimaritima sediminicola]|uniref:hypothetical protein n=1 Tax=Roseimaritima sediminicola TaxID=2662066 RepID=UPI00129855E9|nr:hypothetical protein [Roseimaritima sediminicola]